jgi:hypothetical protein
MKSSISASIALFFLFSRVKNMGQSSSSLPKSLPFSPELTTETETIEFSIPFKVGLEKENRLNYTSTVNILKALFGKSGRPRPGTFDSTQIKIVGAVKKVVFLRANNPSETIEEGRDFDRLIKWLEYAFVNITIGPSVTGVPLKDISGALYSLYKGDAYEFSGNMTVSLSSSPPTIVSKKGCRTVEQLAPIPTLPPAIIMVAMVIVPLKGDDKPTPLQRL